MFDKTKHKVNPHQRTLFRLIIIIGVIVALIVAGVYLLRSKGAQIVFIAPDDNGVEQIWIADVNDAENPRQLIYHERVDFGQGILVVRQCIN